VATRERKESNKWLKTHCADVAGKILSIGSADDSDHEGKTYRDYFPKATSYTTSEVTTGYNTDLVLDVRKMPEINDAAYDALFCSGVLEHTDDYQAGMREMTRILKPGGTLLLGLPFHQAIHSSPYDFWRFTEFGVKYLLKDHYDLMHLEGINFKAGKDFPASYWAKATRRK
jgi:SAM-dependent methyltransferase